MLEMQMKSVKRKGGEGFEPSLGFYVTPSFTGHPSWPPTQVTPRRLPWSCGMYFRRTSSTPRICTGGVGLTRLAP